MFEKMKGIKEKVAAWINKYHVRIITIETFIIVLFLLKEIL